MPSFDIVSEFDRHEVSNAVDQANREVGTRFDFKGTDASFELKEQAIVLKAEADFQLQQMLIMLKQKLAKRGVDVKHLEEKEPVVQFKTASQEVLLHQGLTSEAAKKIVKQIKEQKCKVQSQIQGEQVRVTGKKRDDLQAVMAMLRQDEAAPPLQFTNFRD